MHFLIWTMIFLQALGAIVTITQVGKPREPITPGTAAVGCLVSGTLILLLLNLLGSV